MAEGLSGLTRASKSDNVFTFSYSWQLGNKLLAKAYRVVSFIITLSLFLCYLCILRVDPKLGFEPCLIAGFGYRLISWSLGMSSLCCVSMLKVLAQFPRLLLERRREKQHHAPRSLGIPFSEWT